jgi:hypothetical protein
MTTTETKNEEIVGYVKDAQGDKHPLTREDAQNLLSDAFDSGLLNGWCGGYVIAADYVRPAGEDGYMAVLNGSYITVMEVSWPDGFNEVVDGEHRLDIEKLIQGIELYVEKNPERKIVVGAADWICDISDVVDDVIQFAIFKEQVYG